MNQTIGPALPDLPVVLHNKIPDWEVLKYDQNDWIKEFNNKVFCFREGKKMQATGPYWENLCSKKELDIKQFFELSKTGNDNWLYFDYKRLKDFCPSNSKICESIKWTDLYLNNFQSCDSTFWLGNKGAHTPCHMDTYGCNFVAQIFGRKLWILIPPEEIDVLFPVRIPYEESSIYSSHNFYTPSNKLLDIKKAYQVILSPGDILYVPRHWWHYVENLEVAISVNAWIPLDVDHESRLEECLVRHYVYNIGQELTQDEATQLLNPNEFDLLTESGLYKTLLICVENCIKYRKGKVNENSLTNDTITMLAQGSHPPEKCDLKKYVEEKSKEHNYDPSKIKNSLEEVNSAIHLAKCLINSYSHPKNLRKMKENLLTRYTMR